MRKTAILNSVAAVSVTPRPSALVDDLVVTAGSSAEQGIFGQIVPRRLFGNETDTFFSHEKAVVVSYVDPAITPKQMMNILKKNEIIGRSVCENEKAIEIKRLTKRHMSEADIRQLKFGVSYRIGSSSEICEILQSGSLFAPHWEVREWKDGSEMGESQDLSNVQKGLQRSGDMSGIDDNFLMTMDLAK